jgi:hypothetical protein
MKMFVYMPILSMPNATTMNDDKVIALINEMKARFDEVRGTPTLEAPFITKWIQQLQIINTISNLHKRTIYNIVNKWRKDMGDIKKCGLTPFIAGLLVERLNDALLILENQTETPNKSETLMTKIVISNVDQDGQFEAIIYKDDEKIYETKVDKFEIDLIPGKNPT